MWAKPPAAPVIHCGERLSLADGEPQSTVHLFQRLTWGHTTFQPTAPRQVVAISLTINPLYNTVVLCWRELDRFQLGVGRNLIVGRAGFFIGQQLQLQIAERLALQ